VAGVGSASRRRPSGLRALRAGKVALFAAVVDGKLFNLSMSLRARPGEECDRCGEEVAAETVNQRNPQELVLAGALLGKGTR
jgi:hypothetical protein